MNKGLVVLAFIIAFVTGVIFLAQGFVAVTVCALCAVAAVYLIRLNVREAETQDFLTNVFLAALMVRVLLAAVIFGFELQISFGPDALTYDAYGNDLANYWRGNTPMIRETDFTTSGWGMSYFVGAIYFLIGQNPFAGQLISCIFGAIIPAVTFLCSQEIFRNNRVARYTALFVAFFPAMIIWTSQLLKEGFIIFFLVLSLLAALHLQRRFSYAWTIYLLIALLGLSGLRFYIFFIVVIAIGGGFILGVKTSTGSLMSRFAVCTVLGLAFAYFGIWQMSQAQTDKYGSLETIQISRTYAAESANSGFVEDENVTTTSGLLAALPSGLITLFLAPFPWQVTSLTQALTMPEMILWWCMLPFMIGGMIYTIRNRFRESATILFFTLILSISYAVYQGNLGTLYRQRVQIQVFLLVFAAVGFVLSLEKRENAKLKHAARHLTQRLPLIK